MIEYVKGNLLESKAQALVNTVNTVGVMGKGLALQFKEHFPNNYHIYREVCKRGELHIGQMLITEEADLNGKKIIINFPTKTTWRKPSSYSYIEEGLKSLKSELIYRKIASVAIPPLGSRNGGLDWNHVKTMIENALADIDCHVFIYEPSEVVLEKMKAERVKLTPARAMMLDVICDMVNQGEYASEFAAEKIVYFLQRLGAENVFHLEYKPAYYGPYSGKVRYVLRYLNGSYLMGLMEMNQKPFEAIWVAPDTQMDVAAYLREKENVKYERVAAKTKVFLDGLYSNYSLELLATVDYILLNDKRLYNWSHQDINEVTEMVLEDVSDWSNRKRQLFGQEHYIRIMLNHLKECQEKKLISY